MKYKFQYIDKVKVEVKENVELFLGRRVHETLKKLYQDLYYKKLNSLRQLLNFLYNNWFKNWNDSIKIVKGDYDHDDYLKMADKYITNFYEKNFPFNHSRTIALEKRIVINLNGSKNHQLCVYIDRINKTNDRVYQIHDYKTCSRMPSNEYFRDDWQLPLYAFVLMERFPYIKNVCLVWHMLKFNKEIKLIKTNEELEKLKKDVIQFIYNIKNTKEFPIKPSRLCNWCKFKSICKYM
jgi:CRISPR/Cas system-associated exonuclease Cas4 (RecB family)